MTDWERLNADLSWLQKSAALRVTDPDLQTCAMPWVWPAPLAPVDPREYEHALARDPRLHHPKLGRRFEALVDFALSRTPSVRRVEKSLVFGVDKIARGELDFLLEKTDGQIQHLECTVKFYAFDPTSRLYWGPRGHDRWDLKQKKLVAQLNSKNDPIAQKAATRLGFDLSRATSHFLIRGFLFEPFPFESPQANPQSGSFWIHENQLHALRAAGHLRYARLLERRDWFAGLPDHGDSLPESLPSPPYQIQTAERRILVLANGWLHSLSGDS